MKTLYGKRKIHQPSVISDQYLSFLPATILTLTVALSVEDREVLAYLICCSAISSSSSSVGKFYSNRRNNTHTAQKKRYSRSKDHPVLFNCNCFLCYMSYWVRWDSSSNRQVIHEIINAYEDDLTESQTNKVMKRKKGRRNKKGFNGSNCFDDLKILEERNLSGYEMGELESVEMIVSEETGEEEEAESGGSIRMFMSFLVSKILDVWSQ